MEITGIKSIARRDLEIFIYEEHKTAYGVKGRHYDFASMSMVQLRKEADRIADAAEATLDAEAAAEAEAEARFYAQVGDLIETGAANRDDAIRWILQAEGLDNEYDAGYICYCLRLSYDMQKVFEPFTVSFESKYGEAA